MEEDYIIINNENSLDHNIVIIELPSISIPKAKIEEQVLLGGDGNLTFSDGTYEATIKRCRVYYEGNEYDELVSFLNSSGKVTFSNAPDRFYYYNIINEIPISEIIEKQWYEFEIIFKCQPFGYSITNSPIIITNNVLIPDSDTKVYNTKTYYSKPKITVFGSGTVNLFIGDMQITLKDIDEYITVDSTKMRTYKDTVRKNDKKIGEWPRLEIGENIITWDGEISKIEIIPNWRYLM